ncbi:MAG: extensin family protein [Pseudomonadota bacterium]
MKRPDFSAQKPKTAAASGYLCESPEIKGKALPAIQARTKGCKIDAPVLVSEVAGVTLVPPATINCVEARALSKWITTGLQPAFDGTIVRLNVADSYACRPRNNVPGNPVSVHGLGQAIDIAGFKTVSGATLTVAADYGRQIKAAQKAGCGIFHTILGPGSDGYHENHIHFDVAPHGGRDYCR